MCVHDYSRSAPHRLRRLPEIRMSVGIRHLDDEEREYFFPQQLKFCANENLTVKRSENFMIPKTVLEPNIWKKKPPDFSVRLYRSLNLPRRSEENCAKERKNVNQIPTKNVMEAMRDAPPPALQKSKEPKRFLTRFKPLDPLGGSIIYVKEGLYPKEKYKDPQPHDFRQYQTGFPDFATSYSRDPFNLKFKAQVLNSSCDLPPLEAKRSTVRVKRFVLHRPADPQWDSQLILPRSPWPPKSASYTVPSVGAH
ncbi:uncharacterized protein LOC130272494 isoform X2 [Hyla sarda]|uniref:uncharacterized protein LOC130272494 isoform X2 n=1 Tax=Hyla sarda TaxID=327740 RepID=UPI0024C22BC6|nr:uncharacterized protein LOC130272494 isoform X2 [Hyla sarda]